jgi:hypothetical protein
MVGISINLPTKPDRSVDSAEFDLPIAGRVFRVHLIKSKNGVVEYDAKVTSQEEASESELLFVRDMVLDYAKKHGAFESAAK